HRQLSHRSSRRLLHLETVVRLPSQILMFSRVKQKNRKLMVRMAHSPRDYHSIFRPEEMDSNPTFLLITTVNAQKTELSDMVQTSLPHTLSDLIKQVRKIYTTPSRLTSPHQQMANSYRAL